MTTFVGIVQADPGAPPYSSSLATGEARASLLPPAQD